MCPSPRFTDDVARPAVVSVFSGGGGLDLGLELAGFRTLVAVEIEKWACATLRANQAACRDVGGRPFLHGSLILERDVRRVPGTEILGHLRLRPGELDVLCGGPPCVTFSVAGRREGLATETGRLFEAYARLLRVLRPRAFVFENVKGLLSAAGDAHSAPGTAWPAVRSRLQAAGYRVSCRLLDAADFGVPQHRERVIVVGLRGQRGTPFVFPEPTHFDPERVPLDAGALAPWRTVEDAIADLPSPPVARDEAADPNHVARRHGPKAQASFAATPRGSRNDSFKRDRLRWDRPAKVIRAQGKLKSDGSGQRNSSHQALHPDEPRQLTVRECARLQTFPDWYRFPEAFSNGYRIVGDAVPPLLARIVGESLIAQAFSATQPHARAA